MEDIQRAISALTSLILAHHENLKAWTELSQTTSHEEVKSLCQRHADHSRQIVKNLSGWRSAYGGFAKKVDESPADSTWHKVRLFLSFDREKTLINRCERLEREILKMYDFTMPLIPSTAVNDLQSHVKSLRKMMLTHRELNERKQMVGSLATK